MKRVTLAIQAAIVLAAVSVTAVHVRPPSVEPMPQFRGKFELVPLTHHCPGRPPGVRCPIVHGGRQLEAVRNQITLWTIDGETVTVPAGMPTDLASIPRPLWDILAPDGAWAEAALPHDECYQRRGDVIRSRPAPYTRAECDEILRQGMVALEVPAFQRIVIFEAVRLGGGSGWGR